MIKFKYIRNITFIGIIILYALSCKQEDFLNTTNKSNLTDATIWASEGNADIFLNGCYGDLEQKSSVYDDLDDFSDNSYILGSATSVNWRKGIVQASANEYPEYRGLAGPAYFVNWPGTYTKIRKLNTFIRKVTENAENFSTEYTAKRIDEAKFLRAYFYSELFMNIGGLCIITEPQDRVTMSEEELLVPRSSFEETFDFLVGELDAVINNEKLEVKYNNGDADAGRATLGAALALKGWLQLFAASPAYNSTSPAVPATPDNLQSFATPDPARWAAAAATNKKFIETYGHKGTGTYNLYPKMSQFWWEANEYNEEVIWDRQQVSMTMPNLLDTYTGPVWIHDTYYTWGKYNPPQELIDQFQMADGKDINDPTSGYNDQNPYAGREKRFYDFIVFDGASYKQDWMPTAETIYFRIDKVNPSKNQIKVGGGDGTQTGYLFRKRLDNVNPPGGELSGRNHVYYRYTEVLLNYAEAQNEATPESKAKTELGLHNIK